MTVFKQVINRTRAQKRATWALAALTAAAALTGSQTLHLSSASASGTDAAAGQSADGGGPRVLQQPPVKPATPPGSTAPGAGSKSTAILPNGASLPDTVYTAYRKAEDALAISSPGCHLKWQLLAGIGQVESGQADGGQVDANGTTLTPILGPALDGNNGFAAIPSSDGRSGWDRAIGPMQFIPSTWSVWGTDGNGDGKADPNNVFDAALTAGRYLCADGRDLSDSGQLDRAILSYNYSTDYLNTVKNWMLHFENGATVTPDRPGDPWSMPKPIPVPPTTGGWYPARPTSSPSASPSPSNSPSGTPSPSASPSGSGSPSASPSGSTSPSPNPSGSTSPSPSASPSGSTSPSPSPSPSGSTCPSPSGSPSPSASPSPSGSTSPSPSASPSPSTSPSPSASGSASPSASPSPSGSTCPSPSGSPSPSASPGPSGSASPSLTPAPSPASKHH
ncbi:lytic transglycosylase domain-containing protein [Kitasatospora sp. NPDC001175]|uniref:lytic transglycosylase domain-containing protein n=1 Tax=Kitasatospora sp. NPDC001175 TaxID=3157103 RepID=UPI003CFEC7D1